MNPHADKEPNPEAQSPEADEQLQAMRTCPQCNAKCFNSAASCECGYSFRDVPPAAAAPPPVRQTVVNAAGRPEYLDVTWDRVLVVWWNILWRQVVFGAMLGVMLGASGPLLAHLFGHPELGVALGELLAFFGYIVLSIKILRVVLQKEFKEFSVRLVKNQ